MKINQSAQYGILLALYLTKAGRSNLAYIAEGLKLSKPFIQQIARKMRLAGVIKSVRGKHGGYELVGEPTVKDVFNALAPVKLISNSATAKYTVGSQEERSLLLFATDVRVALNPVMNKKLKSLVRELMAKEETSFSRLSTNASVN